MQHESVKKILSLFGIQGLNEMQQAAYQAILQKQDVLLLSPTGSGKTLGFLLPILQTLKTTVKTPQCIIIVPSRELALQTEQVWKKMATRFKANALYGGHLLETELNNLSEPPALIIGTPGRIMDHMVRASFVTGAIATLVLDEFDKSLSMGFEEEMSFIIRKLNHLKKRILISATPAVAIPAFTGVQQPRILDFITEKTTAEGLEIMRVTSPEKDKIDALFQLLCFIGAAPTLIFCNHREAAERTSKLLSERGIDNACFHGGLEQTEREQTLIRFRNGSVFFLIATDLAARGLDIPSVRHVVHYHLPHTHEEFIHRNGRTARMNATGAAYLIMHSQEPQPAWLADALPELQLPAHSPLPPASAWITLYISGGKKDKLNKTDIAGFFYKTAKLEKDDLGMIEVKDNMSFAAVKREKANVLLHTIRQEKMKGKKYKIAVAK